MSVLDEIENKNIYISALSWGFGHISRTAAVIYHLKKKNRVLIFSEPKQLFFYNKLFPDLPIELMPETNINFYPGSIFKSIIHNSFIFFSSIKKEKVFLQNYIQNSGIIPDIIISDNRYGFYYSRSMNVFIGHQLEMFLPWYLLSLNAIHKYYLKKFDTIWVPDYEDRNMRLSGKLSNTEDKKIQAKVKYISPQSLMQKETLKKQIDYLFIISGTDPERRYFEEKFFKVAQLLIKRNYNVKIIGSINYDGKTLMGWQDIGTTNQMILQSKHIVTRAGFSTLMDLHKVMDGEQKLYLVPSEKQYEQNYLYQYWIKRGWAIPLSDTVY